jgi:hypothetical protein
VRASLHQPDPWCLGALPQAAEQKHDSGDGAGEEDEGERGSPAGHKLEPAREKTPGEAKKRSFSKTGPIEPEAYERCCR